MSLVDFYYVHNVINICKLCCSYAQMSSDTCKRFLVTSL